MTQSITLTASMRSNLSALQALEKQMQTTQTRLSTGKKVNSAIDDAATYFQASALTRRAANLDTLLDNMGQGIQTIHAANQGIEAITAYAEQAKNVMNSIKSLDPESAEYATTLESYTSQYANIRAEIAAVAKDAAYNGTSLLNGSNLEIVFSDSSTTGSSTTIEGRNVVADMSQLGFDDLPGGGDLTSLRQAIADAAAEVTTKTGELTDAQAALEGTAVPIAATAGDPVEGKVYYEQLEDGSFRKLETQPTGTGSVTAAMFVDDGDYAEALDAVAAAQTAKEAAETAKATAETNYSDALEAISTGIDDIIAGITDSINYLQSFADTLSSQFSLIETRQAFTEAMIDILETGADNLVLADMNEESANYLALQTRQQLAINALALAAQSEQSVLKLF